MPRDYFARQSLFAVFRIGLFIAVINTAVKGRLQDTDDLVCLRFALLTDEASEPFLPFVRVHAAHPGFDIETQPGG